jgi:hypothetical protein
MRFGGNAGMRLPGTRGGLGVELRWERSFPVMETPIDPSQLLQSHPASLDHELLHCAPLLWR